jgi:hypothetical protein
MINPELLRLNAEHLQKMAEAYEGYAKAESITRQFPEMADWIRANRLAIAASFWTAIDPRKGATLFMSAARQYSKLRSFGAQRVGVQAERGNLDEMDVGQEVPLAICGQDTELVRERCFRWSESANEVDPPELIANKLLAFSHLAVTQNNLAPSSGRFNDAQEMARNRPAYRIGNLRVPLSFYSALSGTVESLKEPRLDSVREFGIWLNSEVTSAQANDYHWRNFLSAILPINPVGLALCCVWTRSLRRFGVSILREEIFSNLPAARAYFEAASDIIRSTSKE